jgi:hypothetical protein
MMWMRLRRDRKSRKSTAFDDILFDGGSSTSASVFRI